MIVIVKKNVVNKLMCNIIFFLVDKVDIEFLKILIKGNVIKIIFNMMIFNKIYFIIFFF